MNRLHIVGGKNHGKTQLVVDLVSALSARGLCAGTIKHTHHQHELDVPGKDSHRHRVAGAAVVGILSPSMRAVFLPESAGDAAPVPGQDRYAEFAPLFSSCDVVLVEGDSQTEAPKIEVWCAELGSAPLASTDASILAIVTDDPLPAAAPVLSRADVEGLVDWMLPAVFRGLQSSGQNRPSTR